MVKMTRCTIGLHHYARGCHIYYSKPGARPVKQYTYFCKHCFKYINNPVTFLLELLRGGKIRP